ncbi:hypothetical protein Tco_0781322 [Tanacetum coccineum]
MVALWWSGCVKVRYDDRMKLDVVKGPFGGDGGLVDIGKWKSEKVDRIDRLNENLFGLGRKSPPENFSGGGSGGRRRRELAGEDERERERLVSYSIRIALLNNSTRFSLVDLLLALA